jgi:hypothetical protein
METVEREFTDISRTLTVDLVDLPLIEAKISVLNKRAARLGLPAITFVEVERGTRKVDRYNLGLGVFTDEPTVTIEVTGHVPCLPGGWKFVGAIEHLGTGAADEAINLVHGDDDRLEAWRSAAGHCDHCKSKRRRSKTVILESEAGELVQVGSTCLKDFLGYHGDPTVILKATKDLYDDDFWDLGDASGSAQILTLAALAAAAAAIRVNGWWARSNEDAEVYTSTLVGYMLGIYRVPIAVRYESADSVQFKRTVVTEADAAKAREVLEWVRSLPAERKNSGYMANLATVAAFDAIDKKHLGLLVSAQTAMERDLEAAAKAAAKVDRKVAQVPEGRVVIEGVIKSGRFQPSAYGETYKILVEAGDDENGYFKVWGSLPSSIYEAEVGDTVRFTAAVEASRDDKSFGFFKRPTKAEVLTKEAA